MVGGGARYFLLVGRSPLSDSESMMSHHGASFFGPNEISRRKRVFSRAVLYSPPLSAAVYTPRVETGGYVCVVPSCKRVVT